MTVRIISHDLQGRDKVPAAESRKNFAMVIKLLGRRRLWFSPQIFGLRVCWLAECSQGMLVDRVRFARFSIEDF